jgi:hypothetical protein
VAEEKIAQMAGRGRRLAAGDAPARARRCNLERFLEATTPVVASSSCPAKVMRDTMISPFHLIYFAVEIDVVAFLFEML